MFKTSHRLRLVSDNLYFNVALRPLRLATAVIFVFLRHAKGPAIAEDLVLYALGLTQAPTRSSVRVGGSGICRVAHGFLTTGLLYSVSGRLPVRPNPASPQLYDSKALLQAVFGLFLRYLPKLLVPIESVT